MVSCGLLSSKSLRNHHPIHTSSDLSQLAGWPRGQVVTKWVIWFDPIIHSFVPTIFCPKLSTETSGKQMVIHDPPSSPNMLCFYTKFSAFWWFLFRKNTKTKEKHIWNLMMCHHSLPFFPPRKGNMVHPKVMKHIEESRHVCKALQCNKLNKRILGLKKKLSDL